MKKKLLTLIGGIASVVLTAGIANAQVIFYVEEPSGLSGSYTFSYTTGWGEDLTVTQITDTAAQFRSTDTPNDTLGCVAAANGAAIVGKIAVIYRGACEFGKKAFEAQTAGASGVIIINKNPGEGVIAMGPGADGANVTIPVVMISYEDGAILKPAIDAGTLIVTIGNKAGANVNDLGFFKSHVVTAKSSAIPKQLVASGATFNIPVGSWVFNFGSASQSDVQLTAEVKLGATVLYSETSAIGSSIASQDSLFISLPAFNPASLDPGYYSLVYTAVSAANPDDFAQDNTLETNFWVNDSLYSKVRLNPATGAPVNTSGVRPDLTSPEFTWCITLDEPNASLLTAVGISTTASTRAPATLDGKFIESELWEWNDDISVDVTFNDLVLVASGSYDFASDLQNQPVFMPFAPVQLIDGQRYLACVKINDAELFLGEDPGSDYTTTIVEYGEYISPLFFGQWYADGFGREDVPVINLHVDNLIGAKELTATKKIAYPNPSSDFIRIPLSKTYNGTLSVEVRDVSGRLVKSESVKMNSTTDLEMNTSSLKNGVYYFTLNFENQPASTFSVVVNH